MALSIKDAEADRLARELAKATGESLTDAIKRALEERLVRKRARAGARGVTAAVQRVQESVAMLTVVDTRPEDELLGYGADGLPS
jgi:antitoxin VapB